MKPLGLILCLLTITCTPPESLPDEIRNTLGEISSCLTDELLARPDELNDGTFHEFFSEWMDRYDRFGISVAVLFTKLRDAEIEIPPVECPSRTDLLAEVDSLRNAFNTPSTKDSIQ